jgi:hypothetical protein
MADDQNKENEINIDALLSQVESDIDGDLTADDAKAPAPEATGGAPAEDSDDNNLDALLASVKADISDDVAAAVETTEEVEATTELSAEMDIDALSGSASSNHAPEAEAVAEPASAPEAVTPETEASPTDDTSIDALMAEVSEEVAADIEAAVEAKSETETETTAEAITKINDVDALLAQAAESVDEIDGQLAESSLVNQETFHQSEASTPSIEDIDISAVADEMDEQLAESIPIPKDISESIDSEVEALKRKTAESSAKDDINALLADAANELDIEDDVIADEAIVPTVNEGDIADNMDLLKDNLSTLVGEVSQTITPQDSAEPIDVGEAPIEIDSLLVNSALESRAPEPQPIVEIPEAPAPGPVEDVDSGIEFLAAKREQSASVAPPGAGLFDEEFAAKGMRAGGDVQATSETIAAPGPSASEHETNTPKATKGTSAHDHFNQSQRAVIGGLKEVDKRFSFLIEDDKEILGVVAVITLTVSMLVTAAFLLS